MSKVNNKIIKDMDLKKDLEYKIKKAREVIFIKLEEEKAKEIRIFQNYQKARGAERDALFAELNLTNRRVLELENLHVNPFFAKVMYKIVDNGENKFRYISKFTFTELDISSWVSPVASLRFKNLGLTDFKFEDGHRREVDLFEKDNYIINENKIIYFSKEDKENGIDVIYEDFFSNSKNEFGLSEIISKIEKEQYEIIQTDPSKSLIISGPAGSGKTTICLHRIAYLLQSSDVGLNVAENKIIMFVQDESTQDYFASILPKLGIVNMEILTYFNWCKNILKLDKFTEVSVNTINSVTYFLLLKEKLDIFNKIKIGKIKSDNNLNELYKKYLNRENYSLFTHNYLDNKMDYLDISILMLIFSKKGKIYKTEKFDKYKTGENLKKVSKKYPIEYSLIIADEFQNYSEAEFTIMQMCLLENVKAINFIGDLSQKNSLKPSFFGVESFMLNCKKIHLSKVYRNTKQILEFIKSLNYEVVIPDNAKNGKEVRIYNFENKDFITLIKEELNKRNKELTFAILTDSENTKKYIIENIELANYDKEKVKIMTKKESQGTEFNSVISIDENSNSTEADFIKRNNNYIGYTRAVEELIVIKI